MFLAGKVCRELCRAKWGGSTSQIEQLARGQAIDPLYYIPMATRIVQEGKRSFSRTTTKHTPSPRKAAETSGVGEVGLSLVSRFGRKTSTTSSNVFPHKTSPGMITCFPSMSRVWKMAKTPTGPFQCLLIQDLVCGKNVWGSQFTHQLMGPLGDRERVASEETRCWILSAPNVSSNKPGHNPKKGADPFWSIEALSSRRLDGFSLLWIAVLFRAPGNSKARRRLFAIC